MMQRILSTLVAAVARASHRVTADESEERRIERLHDDELSCVLPFLSLADLVQLVRCGRRFNAVARKERSRNFPLEGCATIVPPPSSSLSHHVTSLHLLRHLDSAAPVTRGTLQQLRDLPRLTDLQLTFEQDEDVDPLLQGLSPDNAAAALRAVLPTQLRSFSVVVDEGIGSVDEQTAVLVSSFWAALGVMAQLTELHIEQHSEYMHMRPDLAQLTHLRKLTLGPAGESGEHVEALKQLSQLRELVFLDHFPERLRLLCQPPHSLQLESLTLRSTYLGVDEETMRALLHLPTLTALLPRNISPDAWPLLPQLPHLRRVSFSLYDPWTPKSLISLCAALSRCSALVELTLKHVIFKAADFDELSAEQERASWTALLSSMARLRRLGIDGDLTHLLPVLALQLPLLEHLALSGWCDRDVDPFASLAHSNLRLLELADTHMWLPSNEQMCSWLHSERLPKLERCVFRADCVTLA
jgi:hypothetical protein